MAMTELIPFDEMTTAQKWHRLSLMMSYVASMDVTRDLRSRYNTNHPEEQRKEEDRAMRIEQYTKWLEVKDLYAAHRDELSNTFGDKQHERHRNILEKIFTDELDEELRKLIK
jgi:hypothetical protein